MRLHLPPLNFCLLVLTVVFRKRENSPHSFASWQPALWQHSDGSSFHPCVFLLPPNSPSPLSFLNWSSNKTVFSLTTILTPLWYGKTAVESTPQKDFLTIRAIQQWGSARFELSLFLCRLDLEKLGLGEGTITNVMGICFCLSNTHAVSFGSRIMIHFGAWSKSFESGLARTVSKVPYSPLATGRSMAFAELTRPSLPNWSHEWFWADCHRCSWKSLCVVPDKLPELLASSSGLSKPGSSFSFWNVEFRHILPSSAFWYVSIKCSFCCIWVKTPGLSKQSKHNKGPNHTVEC